MPINLRKYESRYIYTYLLIFQHPLRNFMVRLAQWSCPSTNLHLAKSVPNRQSGTKVWTIKCHSQHQTCHGSWWIRWPLHVFKRLIPWHIDLPRDPAPSSACLRQTGNYCSTDHFDVVDAGTSQCVFSSQCFFPSPSRAASMTRTKSHVAWSLEARREPLRFVKMSSSRDENTPQIALRLQRPRMGWKCTCPFWQDDDQRKSGSLSGIGVNPYGVSSKSYDTILLKAEACKSPPYWSPYSFENIFAHQ